MTTDDPDLRAGDADRDRTAAVLREAYAQGRISDDELQQRLDATNRARTYRDLAAITADLPQSPAPAGQPVAPAPPAPAGPPARGADRRVARPGVEEHSLRSGWAAWAGVSLLVTVIWLGTLLTRGDGPVPGFWPIWVIGPWGAVMVLATINRGGRG